MLALVKLGAFSDGGLENSCRIRFYFHDLSINEGLIMIINMDDGLSHLHLPAQVFAGVKISSGASYFC